MTMNMIIKISIVMKKEIIIVRIEEIDNNRKKWEEEKTQV